MFLYEREEEKEKQKIGNFNPADRIIQNHTLDYLSRCLNLRYKLLCVHLAIRRLTPLSLPLPLTTTLQTAAISPAHLKMLRALDRYMVEFANLHALRAVPEYYYQAMELHHWNIFYTSFRLSSRSRCSWSMNAYQSAKPLRRPTHARCLPP